jgi:branched-chain amino acid transport system permease protein
VSRLTTPSSVSTLVRASERLRPGWGVSIGRGVVPVVCLVGLALAVHFGLGPAADLISSGSGALVNNIASKICIFIMLAASLNLVNGFTGQFSIGHAGFMAVGAYTAAWISYYGQLWLYGSTAQMPGFINPGVLLFLGGCLAGGCTAAALGYVVGLPSLRLRGDYLAIVTLGFGEIVRVLLTRTGDVLLTAEQFSAAGLGSKLMAVGGALGFGGVAWYTTLFWSALLAGLTLLICYRVKYSSMGRAFLSVREDEIAAQAMGIHVTQVKVRAFVLSSGLAGVAGGVFAHQSGNQLVPSELNFQLSFDIVIMVVLGGLGSISGAALAAAGVTVLTEVLREPPNVVPWGVLATAAVIAVTLVRRDERPVSMRRRLAKIASIGFLATLGLALLRRVALANDVNLSEYRMVIYAIILILVMIFRPQGLLGVHELWDLPRLLLRPKTGRQAGGKA